MMNRTSGMVRLAAVALLAAGPLHAQQADGGAEERGVQVAREADRRDGGWGTSASRITMVLTNRNGEESGRELRRQALESEEPGAGDKSLIVFDSPRDVEGTALLSYSRILDPDDQWLYLPALRRVKRISSSNKSGPFVGSEFAFEDLVSQEVEKYEYRWLRTERCGALECEVVERYPRYEDSGYTRQIIWWDTDEYRPQRIDFYDRKDSLLKTLSYHGYQQYEGRFWRPDRLEMVNHQNGKQTVLTFDDWAFGIDVSEDDFTPSRLRRVR